MRLVMSLAPVIEEWIAKLDGEAQAKLTGLRPVIAELEARIRAAAAVAEPQVKADIEAALQLAVGDIAKIIAAEV